MKSALLVMSVLISVAAHALPARAQGIAPSGDAPAVDPASVGPSPPAEADAAALARKLANPIASLISVPLQSNLDWGSGPSGEGVQYRLNIQPVVPITLSPKWNLISRTIFPVVAQSDVAPLPAGPDDAQFGLGDTVQSLWVSPQEPGKSGIIWGVGPAFLLRTGTDRLLSSGKWGAGLTVVVLKQTGQWTVGALANHIWSFAGDDDRDDVSNTFVQPFLSYTTRHAASFTINSETTYDWVHETWTVPVNLMAAQLFSPQKTGLGFPIQIQVGYRHYFDKPRYGPSDGVRFSIVALFPK